MLKEEEQIQEIKESGAFAAEQARYFSMMAEMNYTKHIGGLSVTEELVNLCQIGPGDTVLDVGCGVGLTAVYLARQIRCRLVGVDVLDAMIDRARDRARHEGLEGRTAFRVADARQLPFEDDEFDATLAESVLSFIDNKRQVIEELKRVTKPGRAVAISEAIWLKKPEPEMAAVLAQAAGLPSGLLLNEEWQELLLNAGLRDVVARSYAIDPRQEARNQLRRVGLAKYLPIAGRWVRLMANPEYRSMIRGALRQPVGKYFEYMGYGVYAGRK